MRAQVLTPTDPQSAPFGLGNSKATTVRRYPPPIGLSATEYEETAFFPALEQHLGEGFLSKNVDQHASFMPALTRFVATLEAMQTGAEPFDGTEIGRQVQAFGPALVEHLSEEIDTLNLNVLRENVPLVEAQRIYKLQEDHIKAHSGLVRRPSFAATAVRCRRLIRQTAEIPLVLCNLNRLQFASWLVSCCDASSYAPRPPLPGPILWFVRNVAYYWHGASWQFGTSDLYGNVKPRFLDQETA